MKIVMLGAPGAGKGTQAIMISEKYGLPHISTGDILRAEIAQGTELGTNAKALMDQGKLVPDQIVADMVAARLTQPDCAAGFILDGFPRTVAQAELLKASSEKIGRQIDKVVLFDAPRELLIQRLTARLTCRKCKDSFNKIFA